jgi:predicted ATP-dependent protease
MGFWRAKKETVAPVQEAQVAVEPEAEASPAPEVVQDTRAEAPSADAPADALGFVTTKDIEAYHGWLGQDHVVAAIESALNTNAPGYNACIITAPGSGARAAVFSLLNARAAKQPKPSDLAYVHNFENVRQPRLLRLPPGRARGLADGMIEVVSELCVTIPMAFDSDTFKARRNKILQASRASRETALAALSQTAADQNIALLRTPNGYGLAPMHDGKVVKPAVFAQLPQVMRSDIEARISLLQTELAALLAKSPQSVRAQHQALLALRESEAQQAANVAFEKIEKDFSDVADALVFMAAAKENAVRNCDLFVPATEVRGGAELGPAQIANKARFQRYLVNILVSPVQTGVGAPVVEMMPVLPSTNAMHSTVPQDAAHMALQPCALHLANGGYLAVDAHDLEQSPDMLRVLKRALKTREVRPLSGAAGAAPIPFEAKVILLTDAVSYQRLCDADPEFASLFKVTARCAERLDRTSETEKAYASWVAGLVASGKKLPLTADAVAELMDESARSAGVIGGLSLAQETMVDVLGEAHHWAQQSGSDVIEAGHIQNVFAQRAIRMPAATRGKTRVALQT